MEITPSPDPWTLTCGAPGTFTLTLDPADPFPLACTWTEWTFACATSPPGSETSWNGAFLADDRMQGDMVIRIDDPACIVSYTWTVGLL